MTAARRPGLADVAQLAGVSAQTVSRVVNGSESVSPKTREKVLEAVAELDYRANFAARALATRRSGSIGVLSVESPLFGPSATLYAIESAARAAGYGVMVTSMDNVSAGHGVDALERLLDRGVEGVVAIAPLTPVVQALRDYPIAVPLVLTQGTAGPWGRAAVDQKKAAHEVTRHLCDRTSGVIGHVAGPPEWVESRQREQGWRAALAIDGRFVLDPVAGDWSAEAGYRATHKLLDDCPDVGAIFFANDSMALGGMRAAHERGVAIPGDLLVAGFDDVAEAGFFQPPLTTVAQDLLAVGRAAIDLVLSAVEAGTPQRRTRLIPGRLVVRESSGG